MKQIHHLLFFVFGLLLSTHSVGQESNFKQYNQLNGLLSNTIYDIRQDQKGYIWVATDLGLVRFDGNKFKEYPIIGNKSSSISNILFVDNETWVQNFNGQFFKTLQDKLVFQPNVSKLSNFNLGHDFDGKKLAVLAENKILIHDPKKKSIQTVSIPKSVWISSINSTKNEFCLTNISTVLKINRYGEVVQESLKLGLKSDYYHWIIGEKEEFFISKIEKKLFERKSGKVYDFSAFIQGSFVQNAILVSQQKIAILTTNGLILFNTKTKQFKRILSKYSCSKLIQDREGNWWIGTLSDGLIFIPHQNAKLYLEGLEISSLQRFGNYLFLGTKDNCIYQFDIANSSLSLLQKNSENHEVKSLFIDPKNGNFMFCSAFFHYRLKNGSWKEKIISINQIIPADKHHYILCESNNLSIFPIDPQDNWLKWKNNQRKIYGDRLTLFEGNRRFINAVFFKNQILAQASDGLWLVTQNGAKKLNVGKNADVIHLSHSTKGILITTGDQGVFIYSNGKITRLETLSKTLKKERLYKTKFINNQFYALTFNGIIIANQDGSLAQQIMRSDGYPNVDAIDFEVINNTIYASSTNGFQIIPIPPKNAHKRRPIILLDEYLINGEKSTFTQGMKLSPDENSVRFNLSIINYRALGDHDVFYSVNGKKWIPVEDNKLQLNELAPGNYRIQLYAMTDRKENKSDVVSFEFELLAPFYKRWWFITIIALVSVFIGFVLFKLRLNQIQLKNQILQEKLNLEKQLHESSLAAIKSQMNPHFLFNALNTIQSFIYTNEKEAASTYLVDFSELTRKILEMSNQPFVAFSEEIEALRLYLKLEKMRFEDDFEFEINTSSLPHEAFKIPSMLIQPYVENAIKHGLLHKKGVKKMTLHFHSEANILHASIIDNGIGLIASKKINESRKSNHQSFATEANHKRFELLNQLSSGQIGVEIKELNDEKGNVIGTAVFLTIPMYQ